MKTQYEKLAEILYGKLLFSRTACWLCAHEALPLEQPPCTGTQKCCLVQLKDELLVNRPGFRVAPSAELLSRMKKKNKSGRQHLSDSQVLQLLTFSALYHEGIGEPEKDV